MPEDFGIREVSLATPWERSLAPVWLSSGHPLPLSPEPGATTPHLGWAVGVVISLASLKTLHTPFSLPSFPTGLAPAHDQTKSKRKQVPEGKFEDSTCSSRVSSTLGGVPTSLGKQRGCGGRGGESRLVNAIVPKAGWLHLREAGAGGWGKAGSNTPSPQTNSRSCLPHSAEWRA